MGPTISDYYREALKRFKSDILNESDSQVLGTPTDDLSRYYFDKYALYPITIGDLSCDISKDIRRIPANKRESFYSYQGDLDYEFEKATISLEIDGINQENINWISKLSGGTFYLDGFESNINYDINKISYSFDIKGYGFEVSEDQVANRINSDSDRIKNLLEEKNKSINSENTIFLNNIKYEIEARKKKINDDKGKLDSLTDKIKIPLKKKSVEGFIPIKLNTKSFVKTVKPTPTLKEEFQLDEKILLDIVEFVKNQCLTFERTPSAYKNLGEEDLRDIILSALNGIFEGNATGETFVKKGKTDIHLKIDKGEILVFECKKWAGEKVYLDTIDQLIGYLTWRENYGVIIMFSNNKEFTKVLEQIPEIIQKHNNYKEGYKELKKAHFVSKHKFPEDSGKIVTIHHLVFNIYSN